MTVRTPIDVRRAGLPAWALWLTVFFLLVGGVYAASNLSGENPALVGALPSASASGGVDSGAALALIGQAGCQACHGQDLKGQAAFPNLHGVAAGPKSANLKDLAAAEPDTWMNIWIAGLDPRVSDAAFRKGMPAFGAAPHNFTDAQIATIVAYLKTLQ
jgi:mono/diheme cytochrome c family protein